MALVSRVVTRVSQLTDLGRPFALLAVRVIVGTVFLTSGWGKLHGLEGVTDYFRSLGIPFPELQAPFVASVEFVGGALVLLGLATRFIAVPLSVTMLVAIATAKWADVASFTDFAGLSEVDYLVFFIVLITFGAGALSIDELIARRFASSSAAPKVDLAPSSGQRAHSS